MAKVVRWLRTARGRVLGLAAIVVLAALFALTVVGATPADPTGGGPGIAGVELAGTASAGAWWVAHYGREELTGTLPWDVAFIVCWSSLLALLALWAGQNYRTVSTRRLAAPLALTALGAGVLDLLEDLFLWLAIDHGVAGAWRWAAVASWGKWLIAILVAAYALGGLLSLLLRGDVRTVLRHADEGVPPRASRTLGESRFGLAFSGGGVRASSISLGALQALERDGAMGWDAADHVTSVSGGSYMAGAWSLARSAVPATLPPAAFSTASPAAAPPRPWAIAEHGPGPEEQHLRANLGYLLSNTPRGTGEDTITRTAAPSAASTGPSRSGRLPAVVATVLTGMLVNALVFLGMLWVLSQVVGLFLRWYVGLSCRSWREDRPLTFGADHTCLTAPDRAVWPILAWLALGLAFVVVWVLLAKLAEVIGRPDPPAWLLVPKYMAYGGLGMAAALFVVLGLLPLLVGTLWRPVAGHDLLTNVVAVVGAIGSASAVFRLLRKPLEKVAPLLGGVLFVLLLAFLVCRWALDAMRTDPAERSWVSLVVVVALLVLVHFGGAVEFWSLAPFYRGKLRGAFATYRVAGPAGVEARAYANNDRPLQGERIEPALADLPVRVPDGTHRPGQPEGTPLTICASATVSGRQVRTHYGIPALSVTFTPERVRMFAPLEQDGRWQDYEVSTTALEVLRPRLSPRLTTMLAVGVSGAAVSPAMGRFRVGPISTLLAFFNVRLGVWIPNPRFAALLATQGRPLPRPGLGYLVKEFLGFHDPSDLYVYVTDGGHWENTALVELLRTCHHDEIVCIDADSGPGNLAGSISRAIDLAQLECDAAIALNLDVLRADPDPTPGRDYSPRSVNLGLVRRHDGDDERISLLWYAKPALTQDMPPHLLAYREVDPTFPRVSTVNQFFHVGQFAAYRDLGRYNARKILAARETLSAAVAQHATFASFRAEVQATLRELDTSSGSPLAEAAGIARPPEPWVLAELVGLVEHLGLDRVPATRAAYEDGLYATVRAALTRTAVTPVALAPTDVTPIA
jgi:hypothetical protein